MSFHTRRIAPFAFIPLALLLAPLVAAKPSPVARPVPAAAATPAPPADPTPWLYRGSDVPQDKKWLFGELPNGLRYAIRRQAVPPGLVAVRVRIDAGSLMETNQELGFAHFLEHLSFRGSKEMPELESKSVWQRMGVTFGSDTNANTTSTQTVYQLDLPYAAPQGVDESLKILADMMESPNIIESTVNAERAVVTAELREASQAATKYADRFRQTFYAGQLLANRPTIGTRETLAAATPQALQAFHDRWYRPDRAVVVIVGDMDPKQLETMVRKYFSSWKADAPKPADPDLGVPRADAPTAASLVEPSYPLLVTMGILRPWAKGNDTIVYNEGVMVDWIARAIVNRRLETRARAGARFLSASVSQQDDERASDMTAISIQPQGEDWQGALHDVRAVIAESIQRPPTQAEIDREVAEYDVAMVNALENEAAEPATRLADNMVHAVDIRETVTTNQAALDIFRGAKRLFTPDRVLQSTQRQMQGSVPSRVMISTPKPIANLDQLAQAAITETVDAAAAIKPARNVTFADLPKLPSTPATVVSRTTLPTIDIETVKLSNGVNLMLFPNQGEPGKVYVSVRFGNGYKALPRTRTTLAWTGTDLLTDSGIGTLTHDDLDLMTTGRKVGMVFAIDDDAFVMAGETRPADLSDQLRLMATKLYAPGWDPAPVNRVRAQYLASYDVTSGSPGSVMNRDLDMLLRGGDKRWASPSRSEIEALNPAGFRRLWEPLLKTGPIEVQIFGDFKSADAIEAVRRTIGTLPLRPAARIGKDEATTGQPLHTDKPVVRTHKGPQDQAAAALAWPTGGGTAQIAESRKLEVLASIFNNRLFDTLRSEAGASYSPQVASIWPIGFNTGGYFLVFGQLKPEGLKQFYDISGAIAGDLATRPVDADELNRAIVPIAQRYLRSQTANMYWLRQTAGSSRNPQRITAMESLFTDLNAITPADIQAAAKRYLDPQKSFSMGVLPEAQAAALAQPAKGR